MKQVYFNNEFVPQDEAVVPVQTHGLQYGTGCFEGIRAYYSERDDCLYAFRMKDHYKRFALSCKTLFIDLKQTPEELTDITKELLKKNFAKTDMYIRPIAYKSDLRVGNFNLTELADGLAIYTVPMGRYLDTGKGISATVSSWRRISDTAIPPRAKVTGSYVNTSLAKTDAALSGYDEALLLDQAGNMVEGSAENIFLVKNNTFITPPVSSDILEGITRNTIIELIQQELKMSITERSIGRTEVFQADELLLVGTGAEVTSVTSVDKRQIGDGTIGPKTKRLKDLYFTITHGGDESYTHWLTKITANHET